MARIQSPATGERIPSNTYHQGEDWAPLLSSTAVKTFLKSPAAYRWPLPPSPNLAANFAAGSLAHLAVLEPEEFDGSVMTLPEWGFRSATDKAKWFELADCLGIKIPPGLLKEEFMSVLRIEAETAGKIIATVDEIKAARAIALSVNECSEAAEALAGCVCEQSWRTDTMRARPDAVNPALLVDLKTTSKFHRFHRQLHDLKYPISMAHYQAVLLECGYRTFGVWVWIAVESVPLRSAPDGINRHRVQVHVATDACQDEARDQWKTAVESYEKCKADDHWPDKLYPVNEIGPSWPRN